MAFVKLEDRTGAIECLVFPKQFSERQLLLREGEIVMIEGKLSLREEKEPTVVCDLIAAKPRIETAGVEPAAPQKKQRTGLFIRLSGRNDPRLTKLRTLTEIFLEGQFPVYTFDPTVGKYSLFGTVEDCDPVLMELERVFGAENVVRRG
jgi:DNA polymerase-3 subunit alpha